MRVQHFVAGDRVGGLRSGHNGRAMPLLPLPLHRLSDTTPYVRLALALALGAAVSLGITRFAYGLLLPTMRDDLGWSYTLAGRHEHGQCHGLPDRARWPRPGCCAAHRPPVCCSGARRWPRCSWRSAASSPRPRRCCCSVCWPVWRVRWSSSRVACWPRAWVRASPGAAASCWASITAARASALPCRRWACPGCWSWPTGGPMRGPGPGGRWRCLCAVATALLAWPARVLAASEAPPVAHAATPGAAQAPHHDRVFRTRDFAYALAGYTGLVWATSAT